MKITNLLPCKLQNSYIHVTELTDSFGRLHIQNFKISYNYNTIILRYFDDVKSIYNFVYIYKYFIFIPKDILNGVKVDELIDILLLENDNYCVLIHKEYLHVNKIHNIVHNNLENIT